jgi:ABC-type glycerol-3-phosphate transport system permease component
VTAPMQPRRSIVNGVMLLAAISIVVPLVWVARIAFKPTREYIGDPAGWTGGFTTQNFHDAWGIGRLGHSMLNSLAVVPLGAVGATLLGTMAGFALAKLTFTGKRLVWIAIVLTLTMPLAALALPLFDLALRAGIVNSRLGLSLIFAAIFAPWGSLFMYSYFRGLPDELLESAQVDGAGTFRAFATIAVPLALPAIVTTVLLNIFLQWSELILSLVMLQDNAKQTVTVAIAQFSSQYRTVGPVTAAGMIIASVPILTLFLFGQRWLDSDIFTGGVKQ